MNKDKKDISIFFITKVINGIIGMLVVTLYSSLMSPEEYGNYSLISGLISALVSIFIGWIGSSALRYYIDYEKDRKKYYFHIFLFLFITTLMVYCITYIISLFSTTIPIKEYLPITLFFTLNYCLLEVFEKIFRASQKTTQYAFATIIQSLLNVILFYLLTRSKVDGTSSIFYSVSFSRLSFIIISFISLGIYKYLKPVRFDKKFLSKFLNYGIPMIGVWGVSWILNYCDRYIIALFHNSAKVGIYDISYRISENSINIIVSAFTLAIFPMLIYTWKNSGKAAVEQKIKEVFKYYFMLIIPALFGLIGIVDKLYLGILDPSYSSGKNVIIIVSIGIFLNGINSIITKVWQLNEKTKNVFYLMLLSVATNIILNIILVPKYGINMAALTTLISYLLSTIISYILVKKEIKILIDLKNLIKTIINSLIMLVFILFFNQYVTNVFLLFIEIIIAVFIYFIASVLTGNIKFKNILGVIKNV